MANVSMTLTVLGSGSSGNCYIVGNNYERILLDCGLPYRQILRELHFNVRTVEGILMTHSHRDHSLCANYFHRMAVPVYSGSETSQRCEYVTSVNALEPFSVGRFTCVGFPLPHDETPNMGFLVRHPQIGTLMYMTDFAYCPYRFTGAHINHMMVECNYCEQNLDTNDDAYLHRIRGHAGLNTTIGIIRANMTEDLKTVTIIHVSSNYGDVDRMLEEVRSVVGDGVKVNVAVPGLTVQL